MIKFLRNVPLGKTLGYSIWGYYIYDWFKIRKIKARNLNNW